ncbi:MAG: LTA synthase family protein [Defluviitaleaceae bacterium]|nr:LTA synthase family protein [Defluviitaleaceae bacterium]
MERKQLLTLLKPHILIAAFSAILIFCSQAIALLGFGSAFAWIFLNFPAFLISLLLVSSLLFVVYSTTGSFVFSSLLLSVVFMFVSIANYFKELINGFPLDLTDINWITSVGGLVGFIPSHIRIDSRIFIAPVVLILAITAAAYLLRGAKPFVKIRFVSGWFCFVLLIFAYFLPATESRAGVFYIDDDLGIFLSVFEMSRELRFISNIEIEYIGDVFEFFDAELPIEDVIEEEEIPIAPNVILFMSESFFDITRLDYVEFSKDPLSNFRRLSQDFPSGRFVSNAFSGGTGFVEMEIFVGIPLSVLNWGDTLTTLPDMSVYYYIPSIVREFRNNGFHTSFIHAFDDHLYNRDVTMPAIGFTDIYFDFDFPEDVEIKGGYISDRALVYKVIDRFEANRHRGPQFIYALSMQNHQPFNEEKYEGLEFDISAASDKLDEHSQGVFNALLYGIYDADASLGQIVEFFENIDEPTIIIFLGDHLPGLTIDQENSIYSILDYVSSSSPRDWDTNELRQMLSTDFIVWNNFGAELDVPFESSTIRLGVDILRWANIPKNRYFTILEWFSHYVHIYRDRIFIGRDGTAYHSPPEEYDDILRIFSTLARNIVYNGHRID